MSLFKKPNRNIRRREVESEEDGHDIEPSGISTVKSKSQQSSSSIKQTLLSFGEELVEDEVFQVKKSLQSRRMKKSINKEKEKKKKTEERSVKKGTESSIISDDLVTIKIKNPISGSGITPAVILSGTSAEMADYRSDSEDEEDAEHRFSQPDRFKLILQSGHIPDASMIHAARKRRQQAREMGIAYAGYVPPPSTTNNDVDVESDSGDDERISMAGIVSIQADREKSKEGLDECISSEPEDIKGLDEQWEEQQIRKAVTEAQLAQAQQDHYYMQYTNDVPMLDVSNQTVNQYPIILPVRPESSREDYSIAHPACLYPASDDAAAPSIDPEQISKKLRAKVEKLTEVYTKKSSDQQILSEELRAAHDNHEKCKYSIFQLTERFQFYQELRGFISDLVECLDEKIPVIDSLEQRLVTMYQKKAAELTAKRRQDISDPIVEIAYKNQRDVIEADAQRVFEDVVEEFSSIESILRRFSEWRQFDKSSYMEAYANICLPKALGPLIRMNMLMWNPLNEEGMPLLENQDWFKSVILYAATSDETVDSLCSDPDINLLPKIIEKVVTPKLEQIVKAQWDPLCSAETKRLVSTVSSLLEYPCIGPSSKLFTQLLTTVIEKMKQCVENDVYIPLFPKQQLDNTHFNTAFERQFAATVRLLENILLWYNIVNENVLIDIALSSLLNRYLLTALRTLQPEEAAPKCLLISRYLPKGWLLNSAGCPSQLVPLIDYIKSVIAKLDLNQSSQRDIAGKLKSVVRNV